MADEQMTLGTDYTHYSTGGFVYKPGDKVRPGHINKHLKKFLIPLAEYQKLKEEKRKALEKEALEKEAVDEPA